jgi:hypothetical protein
MKNFNNFKIVKTLTRFYLCANAPLILNITRDKRREHTSYIPNEKMNLSVYHDGVLTPDAYEYDFDVRMINNDD